MKKKISLLIIGSKDQHLIENFYKKAFNSIGIKKVLFFSNEIYLSIFFFLKKIKLNFLFYPIRSLYFNKICAFLEKHKKIDVICVFKGIEIDKNFLVKLKKKFSSAKFVNVYTDDPFNYSSIATSSSLVPKAIPEYDFFFIYSKIIIKKLKKKYKFCNNFYYLPFGFHSRIKNMKQKKMESNYISFVGNADKYRENIIKKIKKVKINIFGDLWRNIENHSFNKQVLNNNYSKILRKSFISINILREQNAGSHNMKTFEIPAQGALLLTSRSYEQNSFFPENKACVMFDNARELENKILFLKKNKKIAERIARKGFEYSRKHSYINRAKYILKVIYDGNV
jgi:spore maturation protein CgeB